MDYIEFIKMLFIFAGLLGILLFISEIYEYIQYMFYKRIIYRNLMNFWDFVKEVSKYWDNEVRYKIKELLNKECEKMYHQYVINNKILRNNFVSPDDLLIKFLTATKGKDESNNVKFEILINDQYYDIQRYNGEKPKSKIKIFEKVSFAVTVIGIVATVISLFI